MKNIILLLLLLGFASSLFAGKENADAVYLNMVKEYTLKEDGSVTFRQSHQLKLLTYYSFTRRYGETFVVYDTTFQNLTVHKNTTTMANGKKVPAPRNAFNLVLPRAARNSAAYNHLREMVITHIGLECNAVIDLDYVIESQKDFLPGLMGNLVLAEDSPIKDLILRIRIPENKKLNFHLFNSAVIPTTKTGNGQTVYEWHFTDVPALIREAQQPNYGDFAPRLQFSSNRDFSESLKPLQDRLKKFDVPEGLISENSSPLEQVLNLQKRVVKEIATFPIPLSSVGFRFRTPVEVWQSNGGTLLEKAVLMASVLSQSGIDAKAVLIAAQNQFDSEVPSLPAFNKAAVCVHLDNDKAFMLAVDQLNAQDLRYSYGGRKVLVFTENDIKPVTLPKPKTKENSSTLHTKIKIDDQGKLNGTLNLRLCGVANPYFDIQRKKGKVEPVLQKIIAKSKLDRLIAISDSELQLSGSFENIEDLSEQKNFLFYELPENPYGVAALHLSTWSTTRYTPLRLPYDNFTETAHFHLSIPETYSVVTEEIAVHKENTVGKLDIIITHTSDGIEVERSLQFTKQDIDLNGYKEFFELWRLWNAPAYKQVVFKKK